MEKVLHKKNTISKKYCIEKRLHEEIYLEKRLHRERT